MRLRFYKYELILTLLPTLWVLAISNSSRLPLLVQRCFFFSYTLFIRVGLLHKMRVCYSNLSDARRAGRNLAPLPVALFVLQATIRYTAVLRAICDHSI